MTIYALCPIPQDRIQKYSNLYHWTCVDSAISILEARSIYGADSGRHANFSINQRSDVARFDEVMLHFRFGGKHISMFGDTFGSNTAPAQSQNTAYHLFVDCQPSDWNTDAGRENLKYWQTNVYPGARGLEFVGISRFKGGYEGVLSPEEYSKPAFFSSSEKKIEYNKYLTLAVKKKRLTDLADTVAGEEIAVP
ncbi:hypothetical protein IFR09_08255 [Pseudomonas syringae]|nr:hypothetical protein [Pseudomonas syringae]MBD8799852.1 hypothetical protein [Pseudomonas syringae]MBD8811152.1 hypothetical protein [Pseudomonas syringae]